MRDTGDDPGEKRDAPEPFGRVATDAQGERVGDEAGEGRREFEAVPRGTRRERGPEHKRVEGVQRSEAGHAFPYSERPSGGMGKRTEG